MFRIQKDDRKHCIFCAQCAQKNRDQKNWKKNYLIRLLCASRMQHVSRWTILIFTDFSHFHGKVTRKAMVSWKVLIQEVKVEVWRLRCCIREAQSNRKKNYSRFFERTAHKMCSDFCLFFGLVFGWRYTIWLLRGIIEQYFR